MCTFFAGPLCQGQGEKEEKKYLQKKIGNKVEYERRVPAYLVFYSWSVERMISE